jgi:hypothetical protein
MRALSHPHQRKIGRGTRIAIAAGLVYSAVSVWHVSRGEPACRGGARPRPEPLVLHPSAAEAGRGFNVQPDGRSAIAVDGKCFSIAESVYWNETRLDTVWVDPGKMTAAVPPALVARPGAVVVSVRDFRRPRQPVMTGTLDLRPPSGEAR